MHDDLSEVNWRKAGRSTSTGSDCVEIAEAGDGVAIRDSKNPAGGALRFAADAWTVFAARVKSGGLDL